MEELVLFITQHRTPLPEIFKQRYIFIREKSYEEMLVWVKGYIRGFPWP